MKPIAIILLAATLTSCATNGLRTSREAQQATLATPPLSTKIKAKIALIENPLQAGCSYSSIERVILQSSARGGSGAIIAAREDWIVNRCGRRIIYQVDYYGPIEENTNTHVQLTRR